MGIIEIALVYIVGVVIWAIGCMPIESDEIRFLLLWFIRGPVLLVRGTIAAFKE